MMISRVAALLVGTSMLLSSVATDMEVVFPHKKSRFFLRRELQPVPPDPPDPPEPGEVDPDFDWCTSWVYYYIEASAAAQGYDCDCTSDDEKVTVDCEATSLHCDAYNVGDVEDICHDDTFTASVTTGDIEEEPKFWTYTTCATYPHEEFAPDWLVDTEFCFVYEVSLVHGEGYSVTQCHATWAQQGGEHEEVCTCALCYTTIGLVTVVGVALDCSGPITFSQCQAFPEEDTAFLPAFQLDEEATTEPPLPPDETTEPPVPQETTTEPPLPPDETTTEPPVPPDETTTQPPEPQETTTEPPVPRDETTSSAHVVAFPIGAIALALGVSFGIV